LEWVVLFGKDGLPMADATFLLSPLAIGLLLLSQMVFFVGIRPVIERIAGISPFQAGAEQTGKCRHNG
jgi:hypothetical protein